MHRVWWHRYSLCDWHFCPLGLLTGLHSWGLLILVMVERWRKNFREKNPQLKQLCLQPVHQPDAYFLQDLWWCHEELIFVTWDNIKTIVPFLNKKSKSKKMKPSVGEIGLKKKDGIFLPPGGEYIETVYLRKSTFFSSNFTFNSPQFNNDPGKQDQNKIIQKRQNDQQLNILIHILSPDRSSEKLTRSSARTALITWLPWH